VVQYNLTNQRGGQSQAVKRFKINPLTIAAWIKAAGKPAAPAKATPAKVAKAAPAKAAKAAKVKKADPAKAKKSSGKSKMGVRYTPEKKQEVVDFVTTYNAANGRGGQNQAAKKFSLSVLTVSAWLKASGKKGAKVTAKAVVKKAAKAPKKSVKKVSKKVSKTAAKSTKAVSELEALKAAIRKLID
jgi:transposase